jgi:phosphate transport system substrate-binding protein
MGAGWRAALAVAAALHAPAPAAAEDATLTSRDGSLALSGDLIGYDGEVFRLRTVYGTLTVDAAGVVCSGPACPGLQAPLATLRVVGDAAVAEALLPGLLAAFARARGFEILQPPDGLATLADRGTGQVLARITLTPLPPDEAALAVADGSAEVAVAAQPAPGLAARVLAVEALVPLAAADNPLVSVATARLADALAGMAGNWQALGGPDMPVVLHALPEGSSLQRAVEARLGTAMPAAIRHDGAAALGRAVARDPWALALAPLSATGPARRLPLTDACGFPLPATPLAIKAEDYPLAQPLYLLTPRRRLPLILREFLDFLGTDAAQAAVAAAGYIDRRPTRAPLTGDGQRLLNAIRNAGPEVSLAELQRLALAMTGAERLSLTFRFEDGSTRLDAASADALEVLADHLAARAFDGWAPVLAGFSDGSGAAETNLALSRSRAEAVAAALARIAPDLGTAALPQVEAYGEALPIACDDTAAGRRANRRVELWLRPLPDWDGPRPAPQPEP